MQLKITTDYAIRILVYLASNKNQIASSTEVSKAMGIPKKYLIHLGRILRDHGLLLTHSGATGGYSLARPVEEIRLRDVISVMEGTVKINRCLEEDGYCSRNATPYCAVCRCYRVMQSKWDRFLDEITIADLLVDLSEEEIDRRISGPYDPAANDKDGAGQMEGQP